MEIKFVVNSIEFIANGWPDSVVAERRFSWGVQPWARIENGKYEQFSKTHESLRRANISADEFKKAFEIAVKDL